MQSMRHWTLEEPGTLPQFILSPTLAPHLHALQESIVGKRMQYVMACPTVYQCNLFGLLQYSHPTPPP